MICDTKRVCLIACRYPSFPLRQAHGTRTPSRTMHARVTSQKRFRLHSIVHSVCIIRAELRGDIAGRPTPFILSFTCDTSAPFCKATRASRRRNPPPLHLSIVRASRCGLTGARSVRRTFLNLELSSRESDPCIIGCRADAARVSSVVTRASSQLSSSPALPPWLSLLTSFTRIAPSTAAVS